MPTRIQLLNLDYYAPMVFNAVRIGFILVFAYICTRAVGRVLQTLRNYTVRMMLKAGGGSEFELEKRAATIGGLARNTMFVLIWAIAWLMVLKEMNFDVRPLLAGAGIAGVAVGFGAQNIIKDVLGGLFLMMENQIRINDIAVINGKGGLVEEINLRTTVLRAEDGAVHIFPNGGIQSLANLTREYSYYVFSISVAYKEDTDRAGQILKDIVAEMRREPEYRHAIRGDLELWGIDKVDGSMASIVGQIRCTDGGRWPVQREFNRRLKRRFQESGIEIVPSSQVFLMQVPTPALASDEASDEAQPRRAAG